MLAAVYLIRLAIDSGWLTPERQVGISALSGLVLIALGLWLRKLNQTYAIVLPAAGTVILFLSTYGAHLYYGLIGATTAVALVVSICLASLWFCVVFRAELDALFAVVGSYSAPFLLPVLSGNITDLTVYFSAWSLAFCAYAICLNFGEYLSRRLSTRFTINRPAQWPPFMGKVSPAPQAALKSTGRR